jgi:hypothetical protein
MLIISGIPKIVRFGILEVMRADLQAVSLGVDGSFYVGEATAAELDSQVIGCQRTTAPSASVSS